MVALLINYFGLQRADPRNATPLQPQFQVATIDLRNASTARSVQSSGSVATGPQIEIPRGILTVRIQLPVGSEEGSYEVQIRKPNQLANATSKGKATIEDGITTLSLEIDTSAIPPGDYEFAWRMGDFDWRASALLIR
jgi:hypothetical protein